MAGGEYPKLEDLLGEGKREPEAPTNLAEASANARSWAAVLKGGARRAGKPNETGTQEAQDGGNDRPA